MEAPQGISHASSSRCTEKTEASLAAIDNPDEETGLAAPIDVQGRCLENASQDYASGIMKIVPSDVDVSEIWSIGIVLFPRTFSIRVKLNNFSEVYLLSMFDTEKGFWLQHAVEVGPYNHA